MKNPNITIDSYVCVKGWTEEEVAKAAEIFNESVDECEGIDDITVDEEYIYLMFIYTEGDGLEVFVGDGLSIASQDRRTELTKDQVFVKSEKGTFFEKIMGFTVSNECSVSFEPNGTVEVIDLSSGNVDRYFAGDSESSVLAFLEFFEVIQSKKIKG